MKSDRRRLVKALRQANATPVQVRMAAILLACCGIESALKFVKEEVRKDESSSGSLEG